MNVYPNCKINIGLHIIGKRPDNFHDIETIMYPVNLCDTLEITETTGKTTLQITGLNIDCNNDDNLCMKAYNILTHDYKLPPVNIKLQKSIPSGAGLGGGSSDAAFTIKLLNQMFSLNISVKDMKEYAAKLGSDCPFFIENKPVIALSRGEQFKPIELSLINYHILIIKPDISINTKEAYNLYDSKFDNKNIIQQSTLDIQHSKLSIQHSTLSIKHFKDKFINDFESVIFPKHPELKVIKENLYRAGALYASMSGSGSAIYGIFSTKPDINQFSGYGFIWNGKLD